MGNEDETVMLPALKQPAMVVSIPQTRRILTNKCLRSPGVMRSCWENGIDQPSDCQVISLDEDLARDEQADERTIGG
jgi:hypothetical protein